MSKIEKVNLSQLTGDEKILMDGMVNQFSKMIAKGTGLSFDESKESFITLVEKGLVKIVLDEKNERLGLKLAVALPHGFIDAYTSLYIDAQEKEKRET